MYFTPNKDFKICPDEDYLKFIEEVTPILEGVSVSGTVKSFDSLELFYRFFKVEDAKGSVVIVHGLTEFIQKYYEMAWYLLNSGFNVFIYDQRGHGKSGREVDDMHIVHVKDYMDYARDLDVFIREVVIPNSDGSKILLYGHSMGGANALLYLSRFKSPVAGAAFSSPMIEPRTANLPRFMLKSFFKKQRRKEGDTGKFIYSGTWNPDPDFSKSTDMSYNRFLNNLNIRRADISYQNSASSNAWIDESSRVRDLLLDKRYIANIKCPVLIMLADDDTLVKTDVTLKFARRVKNVRIEHILHSKHTIYTSSDEAIRAFYDMLINFFE